MSKKIRKYKKIENAVRAEFSEENKLGKREYQSEIFKDEKTEDKNRRAAEKWLNAIEKTWKEKGTFANEKLTFAAFVESKKETHLKEAVIRNGKRMEGLKGFDKFVIHALNPLVEHFGKAKIPNITPDEVDKYRSKRLETKTYKGTDRSIAAVNRELSLLRKILNLAVRDGIINFAPKFLISIADEGERQRILTAAEETRLMQAFNYRSKQGRQTLKHLKPIVIFLLATGCRFGEMQKLKWSDIDFNNGIITLLASNTKTAKERIIPMSERVKDELTRLQQSKTNETVFNVIDIKNGWKKLCQVADIEGCRLHDLRHSATTNFVRSGIRKELAMKATGHSTLKTFMRYLNPSDADFVEEFQKVEEYKIRRETPELVSEASN